MAILRPIVLSSGDLSQALFPDSLDPLLLSVRGYISGLDMRPSVSDPNAEVDFTPGVICINSKISESTVDVTKRIDTAFNPGSGQGGRFNGTSLSPQWLYCFALQNNFDGSLDFGFDSSAAGTNISSTYSKRLIGVVLINGVNVLEPFLQRGDDFYWKTPLVANPTVSAGISTFAVGGVPQVPGLIATLLIVNTSASVTETIFSSTALNAIAVNSGVGLVDTIAANQPILHRRMLFDSTSQCRVSASGASTFWVYTEGFSIDRNSL